MAIRITPHFVELVYQAALKSFWRREALRKFLRECGLKESFLSTWSSEETKRNFLDRVFLQLQKSDAGRGAMARMAHFLIEQQTFPDLLNWEDTPQKLKEATEAVSALRRFINDQEQKIRDEREAEEFRRKARKRQDEIRRAQLDLEKLNAQLAELSTRLGSQGAGYEFQNWFYDLASFSELTFRRPYNAAGRQIDGSITVAGTTYLVELKFTAGQADATDIDSFFKKVNSKADNTMGIMVSISGYSSVAVTEASGPKTPVLLLDYSHLFLVLTGVMTLSEVVERLRRHASQTGDAYLPAGDFGSV